MNILNKIFFKINNIKSFQDVNSIFETFILSRIFNKRLEWNIAYIRSSWKKSFDKNKINTISNPKNRWFADPFVVKRKNFHYIFFEDYSLKNKRGLISCIEINKKNKLKYSKGIVKEKFHLSFPFIFYYNKNYFMIPESSKNNSVRLYKCTKFPDKWKFVKKIIKNVDLVDPIIFKWKNNWILVASKAKNEFLYNKLCIYIAKNPLSTNWKPLNSNPVIESNILGRNAGLIKESNNRIFRISQAYLPGNYGAFISINKILSILKNKYQERNIKKISPVHEKNIKGIHTLNYAKNFTVFDYSKWIK
mgnify:CR=1 FL=1